MVADPGSGSYDIRAFDLAAYKRGVLSHRLERFVTFYDVVFASEGSGQDDLLAAACSNGQIRLYRTSDLKQRWLSGQLPAHVHALWAAHEGAVNCLAVVPTGRLSAAGGAEQLLLSGGEDGRVRAWRLDSALQACALAPAAAAASSASSAATALTTAFPLALLPPAAQDGEDATGSGSGSGQQQGAGPSAAAAPPALQPVMDLKLPRGESSLGAMAAGGAAPSVLCMQYDGGSTLYVGCSDGGCHAISLASVLQAAAAQQHPLVSLPGHAAAVTCLDWCPATGMLASGSEDGSVRLYDPRVSPRAIKVLDPGRGTEIADSPAECLKCVANPHVACVRFDSSGSWLVIGTGGSSSGSSSVGPAAAAAAAASSSSSSSGGAAASAGGWLCLWSMTLGSMARRIALPAAPQALAVVVGDMLVAGAEPTLATHRFAGDTPTRQPVSVKSAFGLAVARASGEVAVAGVGGALELRSQYGRKLGALYYTSHED